MNNSEVCHAWASRSKEEGHNPNWSLYFEGDKIYSYGPHFPIARHVDFDTVLFTTGTYSNTTAKHKSKVFQSISHKNVFYVPTMHDHAGNMADYLERFQDTLAKASRARSNKAWLLQEAINLAEEANRYAEYFNLTERVDASNIDLDSIKRLKAEKARKEEARVKQLMIDKAEDIAHWRAGESVHLPYDVGFLLRVKGDKIETSQHANIPVDQAARLWTLITRARKTKTAYAPDGFKVGYYNLKQVTKAGDLKVDCHFIKYPELEMMAHTLGL